ncbi:hypothetical protein E3J85_01610 [Patescibacteria group bacterium]|nr:MAG: hypothetical protein E3J85_01610 [Patescibacteria group bacterium]
MNRFLKSICLFLILAGVLIAGNALAVAKVAPGDVGSQIPTAEDSGAPFSSQLATVINVLLALASTVAVIFIIIGGYRYITSVGNPEEEKNAKRMIWYAVIGLVIVILSFALVNFVDRLITSGDTGL